MFEISLYSFLFLFPFSQAPAYFCDYRRFVQLAHTLLHTHNTSNILTNLPNQRNTMRNSKEEEKLELRVLSERVQR